MDSFTVFTYRYYVRYTERNVILLTLQLFKNVATMPIKFTLIKFHRITRIDF